MLSYKVLVYQCGCRYIYISDKTKRTLKDHRLCPDHKATKKCIILWCEDCGKEIEASPMSGWQLKRCNKCSVIKTRNVNQDTRLKKKAKNDNKNVKNGKVKKKPNLPEAMKERMAKKIAFHKFIKTLSRRLPMVETPILDRFLNG